MSVSYKIFTEVGDFEHNQGNIDLESIQGEARLIRGY